MIKKLLLASVLFVALTTAGYAQYNVNFSIILDVSGTAGASAYCTTYNPGNNTFISSTGGVNIHEISAVSGLPTGTTYDMSGLDLGWLGIFALGGSEAGDVFGWVSNSGTLVRWTSAAVPAATVATGVPFTRNMCIYGSGLNTLVGLGGTGDTGVINILGTTDDVAYYIVDSVTGPDFGIAKSGIAFDVTMDQAWGTPDVWNSINKMVKVAAAWVDDNTPAGPWNKPLTSTNIGPMFYDDVNNLLLGSDSQIDTLFAYDGTTAKEYGSQAFAADAYGTIGYNGGWADNLLPGSGTFYWGQRGFDGGSTGYHVGIANYGVTSVNDWTLY